MKLKLLLMGTLVSLLFTLSGNIESGLAQEQENDDSASSQVSDTWIYTPTEIVHPKLSQELNELVVAYSAGLMPANVPETYDEDRDQIWVTFIMLDEASTNQLAVNLDGFGGTFKAQAGNWLDAWVPITALENLANYPGVGQIRLPAREVIQDHPEPLVLNLNANVPQAGEIISEGVEAIRANEWHDNGFHGEGIEICLISYFDGLEEAQAAGEIPTSITIFNELRTDGRWGTARLEIIYDIAPDANLTIASVASATEYPGVIRALAEAGCDIIASDVAWVSTPSPNDGTGPLADAILEAENVHNAIFVTYTGANAQINYAAEFRSLDGDTLHEFFESDEVNELVNPNREDGFLEAGQQFRAVLRWSDWPTTAEDYAILLNRWDDVEERWRFVDEIDDPQTGEQIPFETGRFTIPELGRYGILIAKNDGSETTHTLQLQVYLSIEDSIFTSGNLLPLEYSVPAYSLRTVATAPNAVTTLPVDVFTDSRSEIISDGPTFGPGGVLEGGYDQPRLAEPGSVSTFTFGERDSFGAVAHTAGAVALIRSAYPEWSTTEVKSYLEEQAIDLGEDGYDYQTGFGRLNLGAPPTPDEGTATPTPETTTPTPETETPTPETSTPTPETTTPTPETETPTPETTTPTPETATPTPEPVDVVRVYPTDGEVINTAAAYSPRIRWNEVPGAAWYHVYLATEDYSRVVFDLWVEAAATCSGGICTLPNDLWLAGGNYVWWMGYWNAALGVDNAYLETYNSTNFTISIPAPGRATGTSPSGVISGTDLTLQWNAEPNTIWYQVWVGLADYSDPDGNLFTWSRADEICNSEGVCSVAVPGTLAEGPYEWWIQHWGPGGFPDWYLASNFTVTP